MGPSNRAAYLALAIGVLCIGCSAIFVKVAALPGPVSAFYRVLFAAAVIVPWWALRQGGRPFPPGARWAFLGGTFFAMDLALWNTGVLLTSAASAALLANCASLWVGLGAMALFRERLKPRYWLGLATALWGMAVLVGGEALLNLRWNAGDLLAIGASVCYASYLLTAQRARTELDTVAFLALSVAASALFLLGLNLFLGTALSGFSTRSWAALAGMGLISHLGGWLCINYALGHLRASRVSVSLLGQPVVTALLAIPLLGESVSARQLIGGALVLCGIGLVNLRAATR